MTGDVLRGICARKNTSWAIVNPNRGVNRMTSWSSAFRAFAPSYLRNLRWCRQVLEPDTFFTLVRTDVMMHNRAAEVSSTAVRGVFDRFLMTPWMACQNPSRYKNREVLSQAANRTREDFAAVPTRTSDAPVWVQAQKIQSLRWRDCIVNPCRV